MSSCTYNLRKSDPKYQYLVNRITKMAGMTHSISVYAADTNNACATLYKRCDNEPQKPIITYNPRFINNIRYYSDWAVIAVFAHEVAHHYNKDLYGEYIAKLYGFGFSADINTKFHKQELNADRFAGWVLRNEGASLNEALELAHFLDENDTYTHPGVAKRILAIEQGWNEANNQLKPKDPVFDWSNFFLAIGVVTLVGAGLSSLNKN